MSYVLAVATSQHIIIKCDGRATTDNGMVVSETVNKTARINNSVIVGFTGVQFLCELILSNVKEKARPSSSADDVAGMFRAEMTNAVVQRQNHKVAFVVGGLSNEGLPTLNGIGNRTGYEITYNRTTRSQVSVMALEPDSCENLSIPLLNKYLGITDGNLLKAMDECIKYISRVDQTVNSNIHTEILHLGT